MTTRDILPPNPAAGNPLVIEVARSGKRSRLVMVSFTLVNNEGSTQLILLTLVPRADTRPIIIAAGEVADATGAQCAYFIGAPAQGQRLVNNATNTALILSVVQPFYTAPLPPTWWTQDIRLNIDLDQGIVAATSSITDVRIQVEDED